MFKQVYYLNIREKKSGGLDTLGTVVPLISDLSFVMPKFVKWYSINMNNNPHISVFSKYLSVVLSFLKYNSLHRAKALMDIVCVDLLMLSSSNKYRFELVYVLLSHNYNRRYFIHTYLNLFEMIESSIALFSTADWLEREVFDMFGVIFKNHNQLRRILTDYGFLGHPGRKDFPLTGFKELRYDDSYESIVQDPIELSQEFRFFKMEQTWDNWNLNFKR